MDGVDRTNRRTNEGSSPSPIRVVIIDDHPIVRNGLRGFIASDPRMSVVGEADNGADGVTMVFDLRPDVVVMDVMMPGMNGVAATTAIRQRSAASRVLALTSAIDPQSVVKMIRAGALGYLPKDSKPAEICRAIHAVAQGQSFLAPEIAAILMNEMAVPVQEALTPREMDVLQLLVDGASNKRIGRVLTITEKTVKTHMSNIMAKLGVESRTQAALTAIEMGLAFRSAAG